MASTMSNQTLRDLGEFQIIKDVIIPVLRQAAGPIDLGDDCGILNMPYGTRQLVMTSDATPLPFVWNLGLRSFDIYGWYAVTVNVSDLAASGAEPLAFMSSVEAPDEMRVDELKDFFQGIADACTYYSILAGGGNIRSAPRFECHGTAMGISSELSLFSRKGLSVGDVILSIGNTGTFMTVVAAVLKGKTTLDSIDDTSYGSLVRPVARIKEARELRRSKSVTAAADNSDGLIATLYLLAERSHVDIEIEMDEKMIPKRTKEIASSLGCNPWNIMFGWGDYQLVVGIQKDRMPLVEDILRKLPTPYLRIGDVCEGDGKVWAREKKSRRLLRHIGNENFRRDSYDSKWESPQSYLMSLLKEELFA